MVSRTLIACSSPSGFVCSGPVHTFACASSTVRFGCGISGGRYEVESAGFRRSISRSPASSIAAAADDPALVRVKKRRELGFLERERLARFVGREKEGKLGLGLGFGLRRIFMVW